MWAVYEVITAVRHPLLLFFSFLLLSSLTELCSHSYDFVADSRDEPGLPTSGSLLRATAVL